MTKKRKASSPLQPSSVKGSHAATKLQDENQEVTRLRQEVADLQRRVEAMEEQQDAMEQRSRLTSLIFSGPAIPEPDRREETASLIQGLIQNHLGISMDMSQVKSAFRLRSKCILVKFSGAEFGSERDKLFKTKTKLRGSGLFISESLTRKRQQVFRDILKMKKERKIAAAFTQSGDLFVKMTPESSPLNVTSPAALRDLTRAVSQVPAQERMQGSSGRSSDPVQSTVNSERDEGATPPEDAASVSEPTPSEKDLGAPLHPVTSVPSPPAGPAPPAVTHCDLSDPAVGLAGEGVGAASTSESAHSGTLLPLHPAKGSGRDGPVPSPGMSNALSIGLKTAFDAFRNDLYEIFDNADFESDGDC